MIIDVYEYSNQGGRSYNEDSTGHRIEGENGIFVVADGLGGHAHGEVASAAAVETVTTDWTPNVPNRMAWFTEEIAKANANIMGISQQMGDTMKSTIVTLSIDNGMAVWAHSGDSRLYYFHRGWIAAVTDDHSVAYKKYKAGEIDKDEIAFDEDQSALLRTLGGADRFEPDVNGWPELLEPGDAFFLCSDGAWEFLKDEEILIDLLKAENAKHWAELMMLRMMDRIKCGNDNFTIQTIMLS